MQIIQTAAHDLQAPIRKLSIFIESLKAKGDEMTAEEREAYFKRIDNTLMEMKGMIDGLSFLADLSIPDLSIKGSNLGELVREVIRDMDTLIHENKADVMVSALPVAAVNRLQLKTVFKHLIENAVKFSSKTTPLHITITEKAFSKEEKVNFDLSQDKIYYKIEVADNGIGFNEADTEKIFQPFVRLHGKSGPGGAGMGLAICKKIIENHQGIIYAAGRPGAGATITIILPTTLQ